MAVQKRDRDLVIGTYGRGIYIADIAPLKEMKAENLAKDAYLFDIEETIRWNRLERRGEQYGEFAKVDNPAMGATVYYLPQGRAQVGQDRRQGPRGQRRPGAERHGQEGPAEGLLEPHPPSAGRAAAPPPGGGMRGRGASYVDYGTYKVTLTVDDKDVATKTVKVSPDPKFK